MKTFFHFLLQVLFRFRAYNLDALKTPGPVLLIPNHTSWIDWLFLWICLEEDWKFVTSSIAAQTSWLHRMIMINRYTLPVDTHSPYAVKDMAEFLKGGGRLVLFAEGRLSRTGSLMKLFDGTGFLIFKTKAKVITACLRGAGSLPYSPNPGRKSCFPRVTAHFSAPLSAPVLGEISTNQARARRTNWLRDQMVRQQFEVEMAFGAPNVLAAVAETARKNPGQIVLEDATLQTLTYRKLMVGANVLAQALRGVITGGERAGVLLPNVNATPVVILALWRLGKVPAMLNFSSGTPTMLACAELAGLKHIITSRVFLERAKIDTQDFVKAGIDLIYLEDLRAGITGTQKLLILCQHVFHLSPASHHSPAANSTAVIVFTSGSEGVPKGVELTHGNILANLRQMLAVTDITDGDRLFNCLPLFHSFGLTVGTFLPLVRGIYVFLYPSPLHYRMVPAAFYAQDCTVFLSTNTFLNGYARKAHPYDFRSLRYLFCAAEKLQEATALTWSQKYGVRILEGYGATGMCSMRQCQHAARTPLWFRGSPPAGDGLQAGASRRGGRRREVVRPRPQRDERLFERGGERKVSGSRRLVRYRRHRERGYRGLPAYSRTDQALCQGEWRNGESHGGGGRAGRSISALRAALPDCHHHPPRGKQRRNAGCRDQRTETDVGRNPRSDQGEGVDEPKCAARDQSSE